jgi:hypothetical protein
MHSQLYDALAHRNISFRLLRAIFDVNQFTMCRFDYDHKMSFVPV